MNVAFFPVRGSKSIPLKNVNLILVPLSMLVIVVVSMIPKVKEFANYISPVNGGKVVIRDVAGKFLRIN